MRLSGKVALISGAAGGMGAATARLLAREGAKVMIGDIVEDDGVGVAAAIGDAARFQRLDVTDEDSWAAIVAETVRVFGGLHVLVNNAGLTGRTTGDNFSTERWHQLMAVNATGPFYGMKHAIPAMAASGGGSIVNLSSIFGLVGSEYSHLGYNASKGAVRLMTKSVAAQHSKDGIRCNSVHPGLMPPMRTFNQPVDHALSASRVGVVPMGRRGEVDEVANAILFLASDESSYVTGTEVVVDGGVTAV